MVLNHANTVRTQMIRKMQEPEMTMIMGTRLFPSPRQAAMALSMKAETQ